MFGVPAMFLFMAQHPSFAETDLSSVRMLVVGGAPCPLPLLKIYAARGVPMQQGYGLTETAPLVSILSHEFGEAKTGSAGRLPLFTDVKIVDAEGRTVTTPRQQGEVLTRGPMSRRAIGACPTRRGSRSIPKAGSIPATAAISTRTGSSTSATASRT